MHVCVTGGTGFLGSYLLRDLLANGTNVRVLARPSPRSERLAAAGVEIVPGDLRDPESIAHAVRGADIVYHLAAKVGAAPYEDYFEMNVDGTARVLEACAANGVGQFVYASSLAVYGPVAEGTRIDEHTPFDHKPELRDPYSESKIKADQLVSAFAKQSGMPTVIVREGIIYRSRSTVAFGHLRLSPERHRRRLRQSGEPLPAELRRESDRRDACGLHAGSRPARV